VDRVPLWENLSKSKASKDPFTLIGGDLNIALYLREFLGGNPKMDP
jgi:hypothetical protein